VSFRYSPPVAVAKRLYRFICVVCGQPAESGSANARTHEGHCRDVRKALIQARVISRRRKLRRKLHADSV
jgi:hypothetical protein